MPIRAALRRGMRQSSMVRNQAANTRRRARASAHPMSYLPHQSRRQSETTGGLSAIMPNLLPIDGDWQHLIEKRSGQDRRKTSAAASAKKPAQAASRRRKDRRKSGSQGK